MPRDASHLLLRALRAATDALGVELPGVELRCVNRIPHARGLGSSAATIVSGIAAGYALAGREPDESALDLAARFEGHADNVAASMVGVYVPRPVHPDALELLAGHGRVVPGYGDGAVPFEQVADTVEAVLLRTAELRAPSIDRAPRLRVISRHGVGVDTVDVAVATARGIPVCVTPAANTLAVAEHAVALLLSASRSE
ncbi:GHMP family kinase ATP-binding protein [Actinoalloteichus sp. AHMU CJ021]|uniref:GHMP family kinase ATP-binding protein n=1 Tax=Actinoalloteichus sp. AHMU CJ021 TaxID=2072503 RepID=UPI00268CFAC1